MMTPSWLLPPVGMLIAAGIMALLSQVPGFSVIIPEAQWLMVIMVVLALALDFGAIWAFLVAKTGIIPLRETPTELVQTGWYRFTRNPMYLGLVCWLIAWALYCQHALVWLVIPGFMLWLTRAYIVREEALLSQTFASAYDDYRQRVRRWL